MCLAVVTLLVRRFLPFTGTRKKKLVLYFSPSACTEYFSSTISLDSTFQAYIHDADQVHQT